MKPDEIRAHIASALAEVAPEAELARVDPRGPLRAQLDLDSIDFLRLIQGLHRRLGIEIPESDYARMTTLDALARYLEEHLPAAEVPS